MSRSEETQGVSSESLSVPGMDCASCATKIENALAGTEGVDGYETRPTSGTVVVSFADGADRERAVRAIESAGYEVEPAATDDEEDAGVWHSRRAAETAVGGALLAAGLATEYALGNPVAASALGREFLLADLLFVFAAGVGGRAILRGGYYSALNRSLDIDFLMSVAVLGAVAASLVAPGTRLYVEAATLAVLFGVAELLEEYSMARARGSLRELMDLSPDEATVRRDGEERTASVDQVGVGEVVLVRPGEKIPMDGTVLDGGSAVDESPITGESVPVDKAPGDEVYAGTFNEGGYLEVETTAAAEENTIARVIEMVEDAEGERTEREQFVDRFADYYTPVMVALAVVVAAVPPLVLGGPWVEWFVAGITMLVLACPCAFVISTPVSVVSGITSAARNGVLIKGGTHLEAMGEVGAVALDKTGTLTRGELAVTDVVPLGDRTEAEVLECATGVETRSEHPIAEAIVAHADAAPDAGDVEGFESLTGQGVRATVDGTPHYAGKPAMFEELGFELEHVHAVADGGQLSAEVRDRCDRQGCLNLVEDTIPRLQSEGKTVVLVGTEEDVEGIVAVADEVRPEARETVERLHDLGLETVMLTGDNEGTARAVAEQVGVGEYRAGLLPEEKVTAVRHLEEEYGGVAMVGDGVNDAPALASATVGIAMGAAGTDTALETADVALLADDLSKLPYLCELSQAATGVIRQNVWTSLGAKLLLAAGVPLGYVGVAAAVLVGDAGMTTAVTANALRLSRIRPERRERNV
jgi:Cd2+/Zn2+-exporting ATPase